MRGFRIRIVFLSILATGLLIEGAPAKNKECKCQGLVLTPEEQSCLLGHMVQVLTSLAYNQNGSLCSTFTFPKPPNIKILCDGPESDDKTKKIEIHLPADLPNIQIPPDPTNEKIKPEVRVMKKNEPETTTPLTEHTTLPCGFTEEPETTTSVTEYTTLPCGFTKEPETTTSVTEYTTLPCGFTEEPETTTSLTESTTLPCDFTEEPESTTSVTEYTTLPCGFTNEPEYSTSFPYNPDPAEMTTSFGKVPTNDKAFTIGPDRTDEYKSVDGIKFLLSENKKNPAPGKIQDECTETLHCEDRPGIIKGFINSKRKECQDSKEIEVFFIPVLRLDKKLPILSSSQLDCFLNMVFQNSRIS